MFGIESGFISSIQFVSLHLKHRAVELGYKINNEEYFSTEEHPSGERGGLSNIQDSTRGLMPPE